MSRFGLVGPSYTAQSVNADCQMTRNWYPEHDESGQGKSEWQLYPTGGLKLFCNLGNFPNVRGEWTINGRTFSVGGAILFEIFADGSTINRGNVGSDQQLVSMVASPNQLLVASAGQLYVLNLQTNIFTHVNPATINPPIAFVGYLDGFFVALTKNSQQLQVSNPLDALTWQAINEAQVSVFPDNVVSMLIDHREMWLWGQKQSVVYYDAGLPLFPFSPNPSAILEQGCAAPFSPIRLDNSVFWLGLDERGWGMVWRAQGYNPQRVSNHAIETAIQSYPTLADAVGYGFQDQGHSFYQLYFPSASKTWVFDAATNMWHERDHYENGVSGAHRSQVHTFNFGKHLVGDWKNGNIYDMSIRYLDNFGIPIRRVRRAPHVSTEQQWICHHELQLDIETGLGPMPPILDGRGFARAPQVCLRWSDDGGHTWSNEHYASAGQAGKYTKRIVYRRLGRSRDRVYEMSVEDAIPWRVIDAYLKADPGFQPQERVVKQYAKVT